MSLEDKIGQMIQADIDAIAPEDLQHYHLGSILAGGNAAPGHQPRGAPEAWLELTNRFHRAALANPDQAHVAIPILFGIDAVHGDAKVRGATIFPHNVGLGAAHDASLVRRIGEATAAEVASTGVDWTFAPTVAVARDVRWGRSYESYSESPALVADYAQAMVIGLQGERGTLQFMAPDRTLSSIKHFIGDGGTLAGRDQGNTVVMEDILRSVHGAAYVPAIDAGAMIVMASYNSWNGKKLHGNHYLLTDVLKGRMGFQGFVVGDWNAQEQLPGCTKSDCAAAILAGVDMLMAPDAWRDLYRNTLAEVRSGAIPMTRIDDAVHRILRVKMAAKLFERAAPPGVAELHELGNAAHRSLAREAVRRSLVLLKNRGRILPLDPHGHFLITGAGADDIGMQSGGWSVDWQGDRNSNADFPGATSIYAGIRAAVERSGGSAVLSRDARFTDKPDAAIVVFGETPYAEFEGDRETLQYSIYDHPDLAVLRRLRAAGVPTIAIFLSGRPLWVNPEINASDAFVAAWLPGSEGAGIADLLFRATDGAPAYDFSGRLSFSWPATSMPVVFDDSGGVTGAEFPNGFGLDYRAPDTELNRTLAEDPHVADSARAPVGSLFHASHPTAPWSMFVADGGNEVHVTNTHQASPHGAVSVRIGPDGASSSWNGRQIGTLLISGRSADLRSLAQSAALELRYRVDRRPESAVKLGMRCVQTGCVARDSSHASPAVTATDQDARAPGNDAAMLDVSRSFRDALPGRWQSLALPIACLAAAGANLSAVDVPFAIDASGPFELTIAEVRIRKGQRNGRIFCPARAVQLH